MKGVSEIIAIVLILMIVIALAALAYTWFSGIFTQMTTTAGQNVVATQTTMNTQFVLESAACSAAGCAVGSTVSMTIKNTGQPTIDATKTTFYIDGKSFVVLPAACAAASGCVSNALVTGCSYSCSRVTVATDPTPIRCTSSNPTNPSILKAVIATGLEQTDSIIC
ncbi:MAG: archaellin/type IV pilin N-terminal domain-containing protein [Candidatus Aenigmatarchaeota archaeon]